MKTRTFFFLCSICISFLLSGCSKDDGPAPIIEPIDDNSLPSAAILGIQVLEKTDKDIKFRLNVAVFRDSENVEKNLDGSSFRIDSVNVWGYQYGFHNTVSQLMGGSATANYSALMLLDQSGSISITDPDNYRLEASKIFCSNLGDGNNTALWYFNNYSYTSLVDFTTDTAKVIAEIEKLRDQEGGSTPLYEAQYDAINYTKQNSNKPRKAILTFTDGQDSYFGKTSEEVKDLAKSQQVALYNIGLGEVNTYDLQQQATETGGGFLYAKDARQLISIFGNLGKLLDKTAAFYQTEWTLSSPNTDARLSSGEIGQELQITFPFGGQITIPFHFKYE